MELKKVLIRCYGVLKVIWSLGSCFEAVREALPYDTTVVVLQCLKELILTNLHDFTGLIKEGVFLQQETCHCKSLNGNLDNLQELEVEGCEELEQIFAFHDDDDDGVGQEGIKIWKDMMAKELRCLLKLISIYPAGYLGKGYLLHHSIIKMGRNDIEDLPNLKALELDDLPYLTSLIHESIPIYGLIEHITIRICPGVKRLPLSYHYTAMESN
ncbi:hypothetical protein RDABS01_032425 [Bienertia sinuspersici]